MKLDRVTFTGADDSIVPTDLVPISRKHPEVEWGILVSGSRAGTPRFPSRRWLAALQDVAEAEGGMNLALHVCGRWVRALLLGEFVIDRELLRGFKRVQLNFHGEATPAYYDRFFDALPVFGARQLIFQVDGRDGARHINEVWRRDPEGEIDAVPLHDVSHGAGVSPDIWPAPIGVDVYNGYAGGIGPDNVGATLDSLARCVGAHRRIWIDMETKVRSGFDAKFDLKACTDVLASAEPYLGREPAPVARAWPFPETKR